MIEAENTGNSSSGLWLGLNTPHQLSEGSSQPATELGLRSLPYILVMRAPDQCPTCKPSASQKLASEKRLAIGALRPPILIYTGLTPLGSAQICQLGCQCLRLALSPNEIVMQCLWSLPGKSIICFANKRGCAEPQALLIYELACLLLESLGSQLSLRKDGFCLTNNLVM